jgi:membrane-associated phospholipid phosphatase
MFRSIVLLAGFFLALTIVAMAQTASRTDPDPPTPASAPSKEDPAPTLEHPGQSSAEPASSSSEESSAQPISLKTLVPDILHDQKPIWLFPVHVFQGQHLTPTLILGGATAGLIALDPHTEPYFRNSSGFSTYKTGPLRGRNTTLGITFFPAAMFLGGLAAKDQYAESSGLLAGEAIADTQIVSLVMKGIDGRLHPSDIPPHGDFSHTWFKYPGSGFNPGSFPSNHAASAFAVAAVFAGRYREHRWVPWMAYGIATVISFSRVPDQAHFPSDVFAGAAIGYAIGHYVVLGHDHHKTY